ncbi:hypothetical protein SAMN04488691_107126 [Haloferax larsenii]|uniref:Uncharacterized protein n=1 Tax=Haloferax larsenii TaxID=302484 RepID=A0A1H7SLA1_HALLR|nr:hypothetical protein SAMN04488691_107126 [Haloferax larsenii]
MSGMFLVYNESDGLGCAVEHLISAFRPRRDPRQPMIEYSGMQFMSWHADREFTT